jgi:hypothetical protein
VTGSTGAPAGLLLIALGLLALAWGAATLARGRVIAPRAGVAGALAGVIAGVAALWSDPARTSVAAVAAASLLLVGLAIGCGRALRTGTRADAASPRLAQLFIAAVIVAAVVTPALGATEAGRFATEHGSHLAPVSGGHQH